MYIYIYIYVYLYIYIVFQAGRCVMQTSMDLRTSPIRYRGALLIRNCPHPRTTVRP